MRFGIGGVCTEETLRPAEVARRVEELGLESLFLGEHTHIPWSRESPYPLGELPRNYWRSFDPFVALADAAAATSRIRLGTAICQLAQRDPIVCAKEVASVDLLSDGKKDGDGKKEGKKAAGAHCWKRAQSHSRKVRTEG